MKILEHLVETIGPRWAGHPETKAASEYLQREFTALGFETQVQTFPFLGWEVDQEPELELLAPDHFHASVALMEYSGSTPAQGVEGTIVPGGTAHVVRGFLDWPQLVMVDEHDEPLAFLIVHEGLSGWKAPAIPLHNPEPLLPSPMAILAEADAKRVRSFMDAGEEVRARFTVRSRFTEPMTGRNVVARLEGRRPETLVFTAHLDTSYGSPGANNNAGGIESCYRIAEKLAARDELPVSYEILMPDATERGYLGSRRYLMEKQRRGRADHILANINIDTVASGDSLFFLSHPEDMRRRAERVTNELSLREIFKEVTFLGELSGSDHYSFLQEGIPAAELLFWPCTVYKTAEDTVGRTSEFLIDQSVSIALALAQTYEEDFS